MPTLINTISVEWMRSNQVSSNIELLYKESNNIFDVNTFFGIHNSINIDSTSTVLYGKSQQVNNSFIASWGLSNITYNLSNGIYWAKTDTHFININMKWKEFLKLDDLQTINWRTSIYELNNNNTLKYLSSNNTYLIDNQISYINKIPQLDKGSSIHWGTSTYLEPSYIPTPPAELGTPGNKVIIKPSNVYNINNLVSIVKLPNREPINILSATISTSIDSWLWSFNLSIANKYSFDLLKPINGEVQQFEISIDGEIWVGIIDKYTSSTVFGMERFSMTGWSKTVALSDRYSNKLNAIEIQDRTNQQVVDNVLLNTNIVADWRLLSYLIPGNTYSYNDYPINVIIDISKSIGGVVLSSKNENELLLQPKYKNAPSSWSTSNSSIVMSNNYIKQINSNGFTNKSVINKIYCVGKDNGVVAGLKIVGSDGSSVGNQVVSSLYRHVDACREYAKNYFSGIKDNVDMVSINIPHVKDIEIGTIISISEENDWYGMITDIKINISSNSIVNATLEIERHI